MIKKKPPVEIGQAEKEYLGTLNERERMLFIACKAAGPEGSSIRAVCKAFGCSPNTVCKGIRELFNHVAPPVGRQMLKAAWLQRRSFSESLPLREVEDRDAQFAKIGSAKAACIEAGIPIISVDTKKKETLGNFKRDGQVYCTSAPKALDHDFGTFSEGVIVPHGICDLAHNTGHPSIGTSHDTSEFVYGNICRVWNSHLKQLYADARMLVILCDGGGSSSSRHRIFKQDLMDFADRIGLKILVMHYPPYCSKFNPIEHRLFSQITRSWSGTPLYSLADACRRAANTETEKGLKVFAEIVDIAYETKRKLLDSFQNRLATQVVFDKTLHNWNYVVSPYVSSHVIL